MNGRGATPSLSADVALLERSIGYLLGTLSGVGPAALGRSTPCARWTLEDLLLHLEDSLGVLREAADVGVVVLQPSYAQPSPHGSSTLLRIRACAHEALGAWLRVADSETTEIGGLEMSPELIVAAGALEVAVHGWDVSTACGDARPIPESLAQELLPIAESLITPGERPLLFAPPVPFGPGASRGESLVAFLGRPPDHP